MHGMRLDDDHERQANYENITNTAQWKQCPITTVPATPTPPNTTITTTDNVCLACLVDAEGDGQPLVQRVLDERLGVHHHALHGVNDKHDPVTRPAAANHHMDQTTVGRNQTILTRQ